MLTARIADGRTDAADDATRRSPSGGGAEALQPGALDPSFSQSQLSDPPLCASTTLHNTPSPKLPKVRSQCEI